MKKLLILTDYRGQFWLTTRHKEANFKIQELDDYFSQHDYEVTVKQFGEIDFRHENYNGYFVIYQSTEDPYLLYHEFIEDILLGLREQGAVLIPEFRYFRAHHNKVFMELLRICDGIDEMRTIQSRVFGTFEEYHRFVNSPQAEFPHVVKLGEGAQSKNVLLVRTEHDIAKIRKMMYFPDFVYWLKDHIKPFMKKTYPGFRPKSYFRRKIAVQNFIPGLGGDYKVLVFGGKYYVLERRVRPNDFRASGSGLFSFPSEINNGLLNFAERIYQHYQVPLLSLDIAEKDGIFHLIEFQFVAFGTYTLEKSPSWFYRSDNKWLQAHGSSSLETEFARSIDEFIKSNPLSSVAEKL